MFFGDADRLLAVLALTPLAYAVVVLALRVGGKRTLSELNAFDLVVTVAIGSVLAATILDRNVALAEGALTIAVLVVMQSLANFLTSRWDAARRILRARPVLLVYHGEVLADAMRASRMSLDELRQAVRAEGHGTLDDVKAVVLETDGTMSVILDAPGGAEDVLSPVAGWEDAGGANA